MAMTVGELKEFLNDYDDDTLVVMSSDGEGNSFSPLYAADLRNYVAESTWSGHLVDEEEEEDYEDENEEEESVLAIVLFPVN